MTAGAAEAEQARFGYRPGLDGVRALAVAAVILYHGQVSWAKGGFLGVDVFFVLSGYLITSLLLAERTATGTINLVAFWTRRARRLLPALFLVLVGVAVYAVVWAQPTELSRLRSDGLASLLYVSNWKFIANGTSYFQAFQAPSPLAHTWSLAIEEQWYLFWPPALLVMMRLLRGRLKLFAGVIIGLAIASATTMALLFHPGTDPSRVYYGTDTRAQALLVGAALAALTAAGGVVRLDRVRRRWLLQAAGGIGAVIIGVMVVRADATGAFLYRGGFLIAAIAAVALVAAASVDGPIAAVLSIQPLRAIGAVSYGLYLWHWPVDVVLDNARTGLDGYALFASRVAVTAAIATLSYFVVERPIRRNGLPWFHSRPRVRPVVVPAVAALVALLLVATTVGAVADSPNAVAFVKSHQPKPSADPSTSRVLMLGDSQMFTMLFYDDDAFKRSGPQYSFATIIGCGMFDPVEHVGGNCNERAKTWQGQIAFFNPDLSVLLIGAWETLDFTVNGHRYVHATAAHEAELVKIFTANLRTLTARHGHVALLEVPCFNEDEGDAQTIHDRNDPASIANVNDALRAVAKADPKQITFVRWADAICPGGKFTPKIDGINVRPDGVHFASPAGAEIATRRLVPILRRLAVAAHAARGHTTSSAPTSPR